MRRDWTSILAEIRERVRLAVERFGEDAQYRIAVSPDLEARIVATWPRDVQWSNSPYQGRVKFANLPVVVRNNVPAHRACMIELVAEDPDRLHEYELQDEEHDEDLGAWIDGRFEEGKGLL